MWLSGHIHKLNVKQNIILVCVFICTSIELKQPVKNIAHPIFYRVLHDNTVNFYPKCQFFFSRSNQETVCCKTLYLVDGR